MFDPALSLKRGDADNPEQRRPVQDAAARDGAGPTTSGGNLEPDRAGGTLRGDEGHTPRGSSMNISPLDLRQQRFRSAFRGFDKVEVTSFLAAVADDYEQALRETDRLRQDLARIEVALGEHRDHEKSLQATLMTAQKLSDDIKNGAHEEAKRIIREAESRSSLLLERTEARLEDIQREIDGLRLKRKDVETSIEATIQTLRNTIEYVREQEAREQDDKILLHRPRHAEAAEDRELHEARKIVG
jgi:cell division initiation protein